MHAKGFTYEKYFSLYCAIFFCRLRLKAGEPMGFLKFFGVRARQFLRYAKLMRIFDDARKKNAAMRGVFF